MRCGLLYSGGKDSTLAALVLEDFYDLTLVTGHFDVTDDWRYAARAADRIGLPHTRVDLDRSVAEAAVDEMIADGYPRNGIQRVHEHAVETVAALDAGDLVDGGDGSPGNAGGDGDGPPGGGVGGSEDDPVAPFDAVADGTRRDDRVPSIDRPTAQSVEDRHGVDYLAPLSGFGHGAVDRLAEAELSMTVGPSESVPRADYEAELRALLRDREGEAAVAEVFPDHDQTRVTGRRS